MLTASDLEQIRRIVREELARASTAGQADDSITDGDLSDDYLSSRARRDIAEFHRRWDERAARPIPDGAFVDKYDASRLLGVRMDGVTRLTKAGSLTRHMVKGRIQVERAEIDAIIASRPPKLR